MLASVTRLKPRAGSFDRALAAFRAAQLSVCLSELHGLESVAATALCARALLRLGKPGQAVDILSSADSNVTRERGELALLRAVAFSRVGDPQSSDAAFLEARGHGFSSTDTALQAEVEFYLGLTALRDGALGDARAACHRSLDVAAMPVSIGDRDGDRGFVPLEHVVARSQELLGVIDAAEGRYGDYLTHARSVLETLDSCPVTDVFQEAFAVKNLAILVRDFDLPDDAAGVARRVAALPWTPEIARPKFVTLEALGWCSALHGDPAAASRWFREAAGAASTVPEQVHASVNRAILTRELGCAPLATEELEHALALADTVDWNTADDDTRLFLLPLAQAAAQSMPGRAREALDRYRKIRTAMDSRFAAGVEERIVAEEAFTHGVVLRAEGRLDASVEKLSTAFATWKRIGYEWRAGRAALELAELKAGETFLLAVRRELKRRPDSVFVSRARLVA